MISAGESTILRATSGLTVLVRTVPSCTAVASCLNFGVGCRNESVPGMAHLVEHMLGSPHSLDLGSTEAVFGIGGRSNARTSLDYTQYTHASPAKGLETALQREAARLRIRTADPVRLRKEVAIIGAEIERNINQRPHGGLVMFDLPKLMYSTERNSHNGYGDVESIGRISAHDIAGFLETEYHPSMAVLTVAGNVDPATVQGLLPLFDGPEGTSFEAAVVKESPIVDSLAVRHDPLAADDRLAIGFDAPDPIEQPDEHIASVLLTELLDGPIERWAPEASFIGKGRWRSGRNGSPFDQLGPGMVAADYPVEKGDDPEKQADRIQMALAALPDLPGFGDAVRLISRQLQIALLTDLDNLLSIASWTAVGYHLFGDADRQWKIADAFAGDHVAAVATAARTLAHAPRVCLLSVGSGAMR